MSNHKNGKSIRTRTYSINAIIINWTKESLFFPTHRKRRSNPQTIYKPFIQRDIINTLNNSILFYSVPCKAYTESDLIGYN